MNPDETTESAREKAMTQTFSLELSPTTLLGRDFIAELPSKPKLFGGRLVVKQTFVDSGVINTVAGELVNAPLSQPVLGFDF